MKTNICLATILFFLCSIQIVFAQKETQTPQKKVLVCSDCGFPLNAKPIFLPKPEYPKAALMVHASGAVQVQITIDEKGNVESDKAVSGHPLLRAESVKVALKSRWKPVTLSGIPLKVTGLLVFNFLPGKTIQTENVQEKYISGGIVNGRATYLPKPEYSQEAKDFCASGKVEVEVLIGEDGNVISAKAVSGDELLRNAAIEAAKKAKFRQIADNSPVKTRGIIVYNFVPQIKCIKTEIVANKRAVFLPVPVYPKSCRCQGIIKVRIVINMNGKVISATADSGNPLLRIAAVQAARKAKFHPTFINAAPFLVVAFLEYKFYSNGKVST